MIDNLKNKKILILGLGREGIDSFKFLRKLFPDKILGVGDALEFKRLPKKAQKLIHYENGSREIRLHLGKNYLKALKNYDVIIKTPGISPKILKPYLKKGQEITSQTEIFLENCPGKVIGVTGTKGKSTAASLIYEILKAGGIKAHLVGNIGKPVLLSLLKAKANDVYVYELSSHQLMNLKISSHIAVFLNIYPEHGDYYRNFNEYLKAKQNICRWQKKEDYFIYNYEDKKVRETAKITKAKKIPIYRCLNWKIKQEEIPLIGRFNLQNVAAAIEVGKIFGVDNKNIKKAIKNFKTLPHRLEFVGKFKGIKFYNDSLATIPESTISAIDALEKNLQTIILGGFERGQDFRKLAKRILDSNIETVILFPTTGERIWQEISKSLRERFSRDRRLPRHSFVDDMKEAIKLAYQFTKKGKVCLLSPASASFNLFKDYRERGNLFKKWVKNFAKNK